MTPEQVWNSSEWFKKYDKDRFISNMKNLKKSLDARDKFVALDNQVIAAELAALQLLNQKDREYPLWHKSKARDYLEQDIKASLHETMTLTEFHASRAEYKAFPRRVFQKHIYQEERKQREMPLKVTKRNKLAEKKTRR